MKHLICAGAITGVMFGTLASGQAAAAPVQGGDSLAIACRGLQNDAKALIAEYGRDSTTTQRRNEILAELRSIGRKWDDVCRSTFGDIAIVFPKNRPGLRAAPIAPLPHTLAPVLPKNRPGLPAKPIVLFPQALALPR